MIDNVIPNIGGEEEKVEWEPLKMLGKLDGNNLHLSPVQISAHTNRVAVVDGHTVCASVSIPSGPNMEEITNALAKYKGPELAQDLPSSPQPIIDIRFESDRPQPKLDRFTGKGMTTVVGRIRKDPLFTVKFVVLSHNTIRGAAGGSIYNAELFVKKGYL